MQIPEAMRKEILEWMDSVQWKPEEYAARWKYTTHMVRDWGLQCSGIAIMIYSVLGVLDKKSPNWKNQAAREILSCQDKETGLFKDPLILAHPEHKEWDKHSWEMVWLQNTLQCRQSLNLLGAAPLYPLPEESIRPLETGKARDAVMSLDWADDPWLWGEACTNMILAYCRKNHIQSFDEADETVREAFAAIEREVLNPETGLPDKQGCQDPATNMAGLFKIIFAYRPLGRPVPNVERAIDSIIAMQDERGSYGDNLCLHWDAVWALKVLEEQIAGSYRLNDVADTGEALSQMLQKYYRKSDGGFSFFENHCLDLHNSIRVSPELPISDMLGTWMCIECIRYAEGWKQGQWEIPSPVV